MFNKDMFFATARKAPFGGRLTPGQVEGMEEILHGFDLYGVTDPRHKAYIMATVFHETGSTMQPVREGFAKSDAAARKIVAKRKYGLPDPETKQVYYGRGYVQLTWKSNYMTMEHLISLPLVDNPDLALKPHVAASILIEGMTRGQSSKGDFTGRSLETYFNDKTDDPFNARTIINGHDKAELVAGYHKSFLDAFKAAETSEVAPPAEAKPDKPSLLTDKTVIGAITSALGTGGAGVLASVNNPWALGAVALVLIGAWLFFSGRIQIRHQAGA